MALHYAGQTKARAYVRHMKKSDIICPSCNAGYRRVELASGGRTTGEFRCLLCDHVLEIFDGTAEVAIRLTVQPEKTFQGITEIIKH
jgi:transposase-like protein